MIWHSLLMMTMQPEQLRRAQLQALQGWGQSLSDMDPSLTPPNLFLPPCQNECSDKLNRLGATAIHSLGLSANANLRAFAIVLLRMSFGKSPREDLLDQIKSELLVEREWDIRSQPMEGHNSKKLLVQFLYSLAYSQEENKVFAKLQKHPIILEVISVLLRVILKGYSVRQASNYHFRVSTQLIITHLVPHFDIVSRNSSNICIFYEDGLFITQTARGEILFGTYSDQVSLSKPDLLSKYPKNIDLNSQSDEDQTQEKPNINQQLKDEEVDIITPYFHPKIQENRVQKQTMVPQQHPTKTFENRLCGSEIDQGSKFPNFGSPPTLDSPSMNESMFPGQSQTKEMKKSKSDQGDMASITAILGKNPMNYRVGLHVSQYMVTGTHEDMSGDISMHSCNCTTVPKKKVMALDHAYNIALPPANFYKKKTDFLRIPTNQTAYIRKQPSQQITQLMKEPKKKQFKETGDSRLVYLEQAVHRTGVLRTTPKTAPRITFRYVNRSQA